MTTQYSTFSACLHKKLIKKPLFFERPMPLYFLKEQNTYIFLNEQLAAGTGRFLMFQSPWSHYSKG